MKPKNTTEAIDLNRALRSTLALILAGGRGSRLKDLTENQAKPAVHFAGKFRIIDFPLSNCLNSGIRRICVLTQYKAHGLIQHVQRGWGFLRAELGEFVELWPAQQQTKEEVWYQGTADAVFQNLRTIENHGSDYILILAGDHIYKQDYSRMLEQHIKRKADVSVACVDVPLVDATAFGVVGVDDQDNIVSFTEKPDCPSCIPDKPDRAFASMGIYIFSTSFLLSHLNADALRSDSSHDFGKDLIPKFVGNCTIIAHRFGNSCVGGRTEPYWRDVGTIDAYWSANMDLTTVTPDLDLYDPIWPIWTYQAQKPAAKFVFDEDTRRGVAVDSLVSAGCIVSGSTVRRSLLFTDVRVNSFSVVEDSVLLPRAEVGRSCVLRKVVVDEGCLIPEGLKVGLDPVLDAQRFNRSEGGVTLITQIMIDKLKV